MHVGMHVCHNSGSLDSLIIGVLQASCRALNSCLPKVVLLQGKD